MRVVAIGAAHENAGDAPSLVPPDGAAEACGALRPGTHVLADRAHATRETMSRRAGHGARAVIPVKINSSGKPMGGMACRRHAADSLVPREMRRRLMRGGGTQSLPPEVHREAQGGRMDENAHGRRPASGKWRPGGKGSAIAQGGRSGRRPRLRPWVRPRALPF